MKAGDGTPRSGPDNFEAAFKRGRTPTGCRGTEFTLSLPLQLDEVADAEREQADREHFLHGSLQSAKRNPLPYVFVVVTTTSCRRAVATLPQLREPWPDNGLWRVDRDRARGGPR
jgi:hypothetical protein